MATGCARQTHLSRHESGDDNASTTLHHSGLLLASLRTGAMANSRGYQHLLRLMMALISHNLFVYPSTSSCPPLSGTVTTFCWQPPLTTGWSKEQGARLKASWAHGYLHKTLRCHGQRRTGNQFTATVVSASVCMRRLSPSLCEA